MWQALGCVDTGATMCVWVVEPGCNSSSMSLTLLLVDTARLQLPVGPQEAAPRCLKQLTAVPSVLHACRRLPQHRVAWHPLCV